MHYISQHLLTEPSFTKIFRIMRFRLPDGCVCRAVTGHFYIKFIATIMHKTKVLL